MSISVTINAIDSRCRFYALILRAGCYLPLPSALSRAADVSNAFLRSGADEEMFSGDALILAEENSHRRARGWAYRLRYVSDDGLYTIYIDAETKATLKAAGIDPEMLSGSGDLAAIVRILHGIRAGMFPALVAAGCAVAVPQPEPEE